EFPAGRFPGSPIAEKVFAGGAMHEWHTNVQDPAGAMHLSALPISDHGTRLGFVVLLHDMSYVMEREGTTREFLLWAFAVLAVAASVITLAAARLSWRSWSNELRKLLRGG